MTRNERFVAHKERLKSKALSRGDNIMNDGGAGGAGDFGGLSSSESSIGGLGAGIAASGAGFGTGEGIGDAGGGDFGGGGAVGGIAVAPPIVPIASTKVSETPKVAEAKKAVSRSVRRRTLLDQEEGGMEAVPIYRRSILGS